MNSQNQAPTITDDEEAQAVTTANHPIQTEDQAQLDTPIQPVLIEDEILPVATGNHPTQTDNNHSSQPEGEEEDIEMVVFPDDDEERIRIREAYYAENNYIETSSTRNNNTDPLPQLNNDEDILQNNNETPTNNSNEIPINNSAPAENSGTILTTQNPTTQVEVNNEKINWEKGLQVLGLSVGAMHVIYNLWIVGLTVNETENDLVGLPYVSPALAATLPLWFYTFIDGPLLIMGFYSLSGGAIGRVLDLLVEACKNLPNNLQRLLQFYFERPTKNPSESTLHHLRELNQYIWQHMFNYANAEIDSRNVGRVLGTSIGFSVTMCYLFRAIYKPNSGFALLFNLPKPLPREYSLVEMWLIVPGSLSNIVGYLMASATRAIKTLCKIFGPSHPGCKRFAAYLRNVEEEILKDLKKFIKNLSIEKIFEDLALLVSIGFDINLMINMTRSQTSYIYAQKNLALVLPFGFYRFFLTPLALSGILISNGSALGTAAETVIDVISDVVKGKVPMTRQGITQYARNGDPYRAATVVGGLVYGLTLAIVYVIKDTQLPTNTDSGFTATGISLTGGAQANIPPEVMDVFAILWISGSRGFFWGHFINGGKYMVEGGRYLSQQINIGVLAAIQQINNKAADFFTGNVSTPQTTATSTAQPTTKSRWQSFLGFFNSAAPAAADPHPENPPPRSFKRPFMGIL